MKKSIYLGIIALATLSLASCSKDEVVESVPQQSAIEFGTYLGRDAQSRASQLTTDGTNGVALSNFGVFASYTGEGDSKKWSNTKMNFMFNQLVSRTQTGGTWSDWTYSPKKYWPTNQGDQISFWAYAPYATDTNGLTVISDASTTTTPTIQYSLTGDLSAQADFVTDVQMNETRSAATDPDATTRPVNFGLRHELTRVGISAKLDKAIDAATKVNITKVEFGGSDMATVATYSFASTSDGRGTWTPSTIGTTLDISSILATSTAAGLGDYNGTKGVFLTNTTPVKLFGDKNYLFLIPFDDGIDATDDENVTITIYYDIVTYDDALAGDHSISSAVKVITLPNNAGLLQQGKAYNFNLTFYMNEIVLSATVDEAWSDINNDQSVDWNDTDL